MEKSGHNHRINHDRKRTAQWSKAGGSEERKEGRIDRTFHALLRQPEIVIRIATQISLSPAYLRPFMLMYPSSSDWWPWEGLSGSMIGGNESGSSNSDKTLSSTSKDFSTSSVAHLQREGQEKETKGISLVVFSYRKSKKLKLEKL